MAKTSGGLKGLIQSTGKAVFAAGVLARDYGTVAARWSYQYGGGLAFVVATTSMIVLMPLMFESSREVQVRIHCWSYYSLVDHRNSKHREISWQYFAITHALSHTLLILLVSLHVQMLESERMQVKDLKNRGFSDRQLQELGYSEGALHTPSVALLAK